MGRSLSGLDHVRIASPCPALWADMVGNDRTRFCEQCKLNVYNLSAMTRNEAEQLIREKEGRLCVGYYMRADGTIITRDCPVGLRWVRDRLRRVAAAVAAVLTLAASALPFNAAARLRFPRLRHMQPFAAVAERLNPEPAFWLGAMASPPRNTTTRVFTAPSGAGDSTVMDFLDMAEVSYDTTSDGPSR